MVTAFTVTGSAEYLIFIAMGFLIWFVYKWGLVCCSGTFAFACQFGCNFVVDCFDECCQVVHRAKAGVLAAIEGVGAFLGGGAEPFKLGAIFLLALLQDPQGLANDLAGIAEPARADARIDELIEVFRQINVASRHGILRQV